MERAKTLIQKIFDGEDVHKEDDPILKWILGDLMTTIVGGRWNIVVREKEDKKKSFSSNVSASDIGFSFCLLEYYSKSAILFKKFNEKEKKSRWSKDVLDESLDFYTKSSMDARTMYTNMT